MPNKKKKILLIDSQEKPRPYQEVNLGLLSVGTVLKKNNYEVIIKKGTSDNPSEIDKYIDDKIICIGFTVKTSQVNSALKLSKYIKNKFGKKIKIVWGGIHVNLCSKQVLDNENIDIVVFGDGEYTMLEIVKHIQSGKKLKGIKGCGFKENGKIILNDKREFNDISKLPMLDYSIVEDIDKYKEDSKKMSVKPGVAWMPVLSGVGCPFRCSFCYNSIQKERSSRRKIDTLLDEIEFIKNNFDVHQFGITDELFLADKKRVEEFLMKKKERGLKFEWDTTAHINLLRDDSLYTDKLLLEMKNEGLILFGIGIESGSVEQLKRYRKNINIKDIIKVTKRMDKLQIPTSYLFMIGAPHEKHKDMIDSVKLVYTIKSISPNYSEIWNMTLFRPVPGADLYNEAIKLGYQQKIDLEEYNKRMEFVGDLNIEELPYLRKDISKIENIIYYMRIIRGIFNSNKNIVNIFTFPPVYHFMRSKYTINNVGFLSRIILENEFLNKYFFRKFFGKNLSVFNKSSKNSD